MLDETTMRPQLETLRRELHEREKEAARLQADLSALRNMVGGYELWLQNHGRQTEQTEEVTQHPRFVEVKAPPISFRSAVRKVVEDAGGEWLHLNEILGRAEALGAHTNAKRKANTVDFVLYNLRESGQPLEKKQGGFWRWTGDPTAASGHEG